MRVLWICDQLLSEFASEFGIRPRHMDEGWMTGILHLLCDEGIEIGVCQPIIDEWRIKSGKTEHYAYYGFHQLNHLPYKTEMKDEFISIIEDFKPDVIHIWGTEMNHSMAMIEAADELGMENRTIVHMQGLVSFLAGHYTLNIPEEWIAKGYENREGIGFGRDEFVRHGETEKEVLRRAAIVCGRTNWDKMCLQMIAPNARYVHCGEVLRKRFYKARKWELEKCKRHSVFFSQANYPIKGFHLAIPALAVVKERFDDLEVNIAGNDILHPVKGELSYYAQYIRELIMKYDLQDSIHFLGMQSEEEMIEQYQRAHVFVSPSTCENSSNSICEAMMIGTPVVASYTGGTPNLITHEKDGLLYPVDADYTLASYISDLFKDDNKAQALSESAALRAAQRHDRKRIVSELVKVYQTVV